MLTGRRPNWKPEFGSGLAAEWGGALKTGFPIGAGSESGCCMDDIGTLLDESRADSLRRTLGDWVSVVFDDERAGGIVQFKCKADVCCLSVAQGIRYRFVRDAAEVQCDRIRNIPAPVAEHH